MTGTQHSSTLIVNAHIYCPSVPFASALFIHQGHIAWVGDGSGAQVHEEIADRVIDARGQFIAPAFVDAHVHATSTGLLLDGLDLTGVRHRKELLDLVSSYARLIKGAPVIGHGWDQTEWTDPTLPSRTEIDRASWGSVVYLSRIDVHSALISSALLAQMPEAARSEGFGDHSVSAQAHQLLRAQALDHITIDQRRNAQIAFGNHALARGIASVHEMAGPAISSADDARLLMELSRNGFGPEVYLYWGQLASEGGLAMVQELGAVGAGGDLFIDGAIGSRTAALHSAYSDAPDTSGVSYLTSEQVSDHVSACSDANIQSGFHVIGDRGMSIALDGITRSFDKGRFNKRLRHRLEHAELTTNDHMQAITQFGITSSMQPLFDSLWGVPGGMYANRLGERSHQMNRWGSLLSQGASVCFSSDAPVTDMDPWRAVHAAMFHNNVSERISARAAFSAHTRAGWRALGAQFDGTGVIEVGSPAHLAMWDVENYSVQVPDQRVSSWSTDPRSATAPLPDLGSAKNPSIPTCTMTLVGGQIRHALGDLEEYL